MIILWFTWKDRKNPLAGGAEVVNEELAKRAVADGHKVIFLTAGFKGAEKDEMVDGYRVIRVGNKWTVYWYAYRYYKKHLQNSVDIVIDEMNTVPFFAKYYVKEKNILFVHQLCRQIWFFQMFFPLSLLGYLAEPIYLWLLRDREVVTISESTKKDLIRYGFKENKIGIISEGILIRPVENLNIEKYHVPTLLSVGSVRAMKRSHHIIKTFEIVKKNIPDLRLILAGEAECGYGRLVLNKIKKSVHADSIEYLGKISEEKKVEIMRKSHLLIVASVKEGWGLVVTEANSQGIPAIVYNVDGLRDSVKDGYTGLVCIENTPENLSKKVVGALRDRGAYEKMRLHGWQWSKEINFNKSYEDFIRFL